jgi:hypothetical protein
VKLALVLATGLLAQSILAQSDVWQHVKVSYSQQIHRVAVPQSQQKSIVKLLKARASVDGWGCDSETDEWLTNLIYETVPLSPRVKVFLVEAGTGCARGGQGSNGAMWLIRFDGTNPTLLATPEQRFGGWFHSVQPTASHGYRDIVVGWHIGAAEADLSYFRFDGKSYNRIDSATLRTDDQDVTRIIPIH